VRPPGAVDAGDDHRARRLALAVGAAYLAALLYLTLVAPALTGVAWPIRHNWVPLRTIGLYWREGGPGFTVNVLGNLAAFAPVGLLVPHFGPRWASAARVAFVAAATSGLVEALQLFTSRRVADVDDVLLNVLGGLVGYAAYRIVRRARRVPGALPVGGAIRTMRDGPDRRGRTNE